MYLRKSQYKKIVIFFGVFFVSLIFSLRWGINAANAATTSTVSANKVGSLIGFWTMDNGDFNGLTMFDKSGYGNNATSTGSTSIPGKLKQGRKFNGTSNYLQVADSANLSPTSALTVSLWANQTLLSANKFMMAKWNYQTDGTWSVGVSDTTSTVLQVNIASSAAEAVGVNNIYSPSGAWSANVWHHVVFTYDGTQTGNTNRLKLYIDGVNQIVSTSGTIPAALLDSAAPINIGQFGGTLTNYWNGSIDDVRIYNYALSSKEVSRLYNSARNNVVSSEPLNGLKGFWSMDNRDIATSTTWFNMAGGGNNVSKRGAPTVVPGRIGQALSITANTQRLNGAATTIGNFTNGTITAWVNPSTLTGGSSCNTHNGSGSCRSISWNDDFGWFFGINSDGALFMDLGNGSNSWSVTNNTVAGAVVTNKWQFVAVTVNGTTVKYYLDDKLFQKNTVGANSGLKMGSNSRLGIGGADRNDNFNFRGLLDEVRIYNRALSDAEINQLYRAAGKMKLKSR